MTAETKYDLLLSLGIGTAFLLLLHLDHLVASYSSWKDPEWLLHLVVDGGYVIVYGTFAWFALRGWRLWRRSAGSGDGRED